MYTVHTPSSWHPKVCVPPPPFPKEPLLLHIKLLLYVLINLLPLSIYTEWQGVWPMGRGHLKRVEVEVGRSGLEQAVDLLRAGQHRILLLNGLHLQRHKDAASNRYKQ